MTIFDFISDILFTKKKNCLSNIDYESVFSPFMLNRWISMYNNTLAIKCNLLNKYTSFSKSDMYSLFINIFDRVPVKKITYFKKIKNNTESEDDNTGLLAKALELSTRELNSYKQVLNFVKKEIK
jgi:hypothetical protein